MKLCNVCQKGTKSIFNICWTCIIRKYSFTKSSKLCTWCKVEPMMNFKKQICASCWAEEMQGKIEND